MPQSPSLERERERERERASAITFRFVTRVGNFAGIPSAAAAAEAAAALISLFLPPPLPLPFPQSRAGGRGREDRHLSFLPLSPTAAAAATEDFVDGFEPLPISWPYLATPAASKINTARARTGSAGGGDRGGGRGGGGTVAKNQRPDGETRDLKSVDSTGECKAALHLSSTRSWSSIIEAESKEGGGNYLLSLLSLPLSS